MTKTALILLADGCEETEAITVFDLLVRANIQVTTASITERLDIHCSRGMHLVADTTLANVAHNPFDAVILPGGLQGAEHFRDSQAVIEILKKTHQDGNLVAAICASPAFVLQHHHLFPTAKMTGYPGTQSQFTAGTWVNERVYLSEKEKVLTSQGPGTSLDFGLAIIAALKGKTQAAEVATQLVLPQGIDDYT